MYGPGNGYSPYIAPGPPMYDPQQQARWQEGKEISRRGMGIGFAIIGMELVSFVVALIVMAAAGGAGILDVYASSADFWFMPQEIFYIVYSIIYLAMVVLPFLVLALCFRMRRRECLPFYRSARPGLMVVGGIAGVSVSLVANQMAATFITELDTMFGILPNLTEMAIGDSVASKILYFIIVAVLPAFAEEFAFRGVVLGLLRPYGEAFAVIGSAFVFGAMHGNIVQIPFAFVIGLFLGYLVIRTGSIWPAIITHFVNNGISAVQALVQNEAAGSITQQTADIISYGLCLAAILVGLCCFKVLLKQDVDFFRFRKTDHLLTDRQKFSRYIANVGMILGLVVVGIKVLSTIDLRTFA